MRRILPLLFLGLVVPACVAQPGCPSGALADAAKTVQNVRHELHTASVGEFEPNVPPAIASQLLQLKAALADAATAAFACARDSATPEELQNTLAEALHANLAGASDTVTVAGRKDLGAYGSDLAVQVFPLFNSPRYYEVNFRFGVECGDDNLLMVFEATQRGAQQGAWNEILRWGAPAYHTVSDAFGDFVLMTPLSGFPGQRNWRFVVAHGQPGCNGRGAASRFDLDLLEPSADPSHPVVVWHLEQPYLRSQEPRLSTTEDTLTFELRTPGKPAGKRPKAPEAASSSFRYRVTRDNKVEPLTGTPASGASTQQSASTSSPQ